MTRVEFLEELKEVLAGKMNAGEIQSHVDYYNSYINEEMQKGKTEEEVLEELGSPFAIGKTLLMPYENSEREYERTQETVTRNENTEDNNAKKILTIVIVIAIGLMILSIMFGLLAFVIRYAVPIAAIVLVVYFFKKR